MVTKKKEENNKPQDRPQYYHNGSIDVIEFLERYFTINPKISVVEGFHIGNIIKYVCRYKEKDGYHDLKKAQDYLNKLVEVEMKMEMTRIKNT